MPIKLCVFDFDGVFTDGKVYFDANKSMLKSYNVKDGLGIKRLRDAGVKTGVISNYKENHAQLAIIEHLGFDHVSIACKHKLETLQGWCDELGISIGKDVSYMGDDVPDVDVLDKVAYSACPSDAVDVVQKAIQFKCRARGGEGCVREFCDHLLNRNLDIEPRKCAKNGDATIRA